MGMVWEAYRKGVPSLEVPRKNPYEISIKKKGEMFIQPTPVLDGSTFSHLEWRGPSTVCAGVRCLDTGVPHGNQRKNTPPKFNIYIYIHTYIYTYIYGQFIINP